MATSNYFPPPKKTETTCNERIDPKIAPEGCENAKMYTMHCERSGKYNRSNNFSVVYYSFGPYVYKKDRLQQRRPLSCTK